MTKRNISPKSLKNLYQSNQEANQITRESIETALLHLMEKKDLPQISISELVKKAGVSRNAFDGRGNYTFGIKEQLIFPEIDFDKVAKVRGMDIVVVTTAKTDKEAYSLLELLGVPFHR